MDFILIAGSAALGGIVVALLGWTGTKEPFDPRKFISSVIRAVIGGLGIAVIYVFGGALTPLDYAVAFLAGAGVDAGGKRVAGAIAARMK